MSVSVTLCIATCKRPNGLKRLLNSLKALHFDGQFNIVIVDNDASKQEGIAVSKAMREDGYPWPILHTLEPQKGISFARNTGVNLAIEKTDPDFIAFLDDDEFVEPQWLDELLRVQKKFNVDVVKGRVIAHFDFMPPTWINRGNFYYTKRYDEGPIPVPTGTGNALCKTSVIRPLQPEIFAPQFAISGGSDIDLFYRMKKTGITFAWADNARAFEVIPKSRTTKPWLRQRSYRVGNTNVFVQRRHAPGFFHEIKRLIKTAGLLTLSSLYYLISLPSEYHRLKASIMFYRGMGKVNGHFSNLYQEYKTVHGN